MVVSAVPCGDAAPARIDSHSGQLGEVALAQHAEDRDWIVPAEIAGRCTDDGELSGELFVQASGDRRVVWAKIRCVNIAVVEQLEDLVVDLLVEEQENSISEMDLVPDGGISCDSGPTAMVLDILRWFREIEKVAVYLKASFNRKLVCERRHDGF